MFFAILQIYLYVYMLLYTCKYSEIFAEMYVCFWHFARSLIQAWTLTFTLPDTCTRPRVGSKVSESKGVRECVSFALYIFIYSSACPLNVYAYVHIYMIVQNFFVLYSIFWLPRKAFQGQPLFVWQLIKKFRCRWVVKVCL